MSQLRSESTVIRPLLAPWGPVLVGLALVTLSTVALAASPPRLGLMITEDNSALTVDCLTPIAARISTLLDNQKSATLIQATGPASSWEEFAATDDLQLVAQLKVARCEVSYAGQMYVEANNSVYHMYTAETLLHLSIVDVASGEVSFQAEVKGQATANESEEFKADDSFSIMDVTAATALPGPALALHAAKVAYVATSIAQALDALDEAKRHHASLVGQYSMKFDTTLMGSIDQVMKKAAKTVGQALPIRGTITTIATKEATLDVGESWGVTRGMKFIAYRRGDDGKEAELGVLSVKAVSTDTTIVKASKKVLSGLQTGDLIRSK